jgi:drug/metabolite transporter (DMT)-like permease
MSATIARAPELSARDRLNLGPIAAYLVLCFVWGSTFLAIRVAVQTVPPWTMIGTRCLVAGAILAAFALVRGAAWPNGRALASAAVSGMFLFAGSQALLAWGELRLPSGEAAVLVCTGSLLTPVATWLFGASRRPSATAFAGLLLGFAGVVFLVRPHAGALHAAGHFAASLGVLGSSLSWSVGAALAKRVKPADSALLGSGLQLLAGGVVSMAFAVLRGEWVHLDPALISWPSIEAMAYLIVMGSLVAFACFGWLVHIWRPEVLSTYGFVNPVVALVLGAVLLGEMVGQREVVATLIILAGVALVMAGNRAPPAVPER